MLIILIITIALFIWGKFTPDIIALISMLSLFLFGILTLDETLSGFSNPTVIMIAALFIIGEGELKKDLEELINKENLNEKVFLLGFKDNVYKYLNNCKCFILSSFWEDPGFVLIEAGIANATIISSNCPNGPVEILESGKNGYLFKSNNEKDFYIKFDDFINSDMETIMKKKLNLKKNIKIYTKFYHYKKIFNLFK